MMAALDTVVIGGGPAGSCAAFRLAAAGHRVLVLERRTVAGLPVRCGELIRTRSLAWVTDPDGPATVLCFSAYVVEGPRGAHVRFEGRDFGRMIDRARFDADLLDRAAAAGAAIRLGATVVGAERNAGGTFSITLEGGERLAARTVIAADGVASRAARWLGLRTATSLRGTAAAAFGIVAHADLGTALPTLRFGADLTPGGYAWLFPLGDGRANIGVGLDAARASGSALEILSRYAAMCAPRAAVTSVRVGGLPITRPLRPAHADGVLVIGDAARQVNPLTGAGIGMAARSGTLAGDVLAAALGADDVSAARLQRFDTEWQRAHGPFHWRSAAIRRHLDTVPDDRLDRLIRALPQTLQHRSVAEDLGLMTAGAE